jgi:glycosyltransferase involved in cell wall biosynthesis
LEAALAQPLSGYRLFTGTHQTASIFSPAVKQSRRWSLRRLASDIRRAVPGRIVSLFTEKCYAATVDCGDIAAKYYGVPGAQIEVCSLGVDTDIFFPANANVDTLASRESKRRALGFGAGELVCVYSGRMNTEKNPLLLAQAVAQLRSRGEPFRALFVGHGTQAKEIGACDGCVVHGFVPVADLPPFYRAADIGVWPAYESMSMMDAAACGIPIVVSDTVLATERFAGNGLTYRLGDMGSLVETLSRLRDPELRRRLGEFGATKMAANFSWTAIAHRRIADYERSLTGRGGKTRRTEAVSAKERRAAAER